MDFRKLLKSESKSTLIYLVSTLVTGFGSFLIIPIYWSKLSLSDYGIIAVTDLLSGILGIFLGLNIEQGITRYYYEWNTNERKFALGSLWLTSWGAIILMFPLFFAIVYFFSDSLFPDIDFYPYIFIGLIISFLTPFDRIPTVVFRVLQRPYLYSGFNIISFFITNATALIFVFAYNMGVIGYLYAMILSKIVLIIAYTIIMLLLAKPTLRWKYVKEPLAFSFNFVFPEIVTSISSQGDRYLLQLLLNVKLLGIYSISLKFGALYTNIHNILKLSYVPFLIKTAAEEENGTNIVKKTIPFYIVPMFFGFVIISLFADNLIVLIGNKEYFPIIDYLPWVCFSLLIPSLYMYYAPGIYLSKNTKYLIYPPLASSLLFLVFSPILVPFMSLFGLIIAKVIAGVGYLYVSLVLSKKLYNWDNDFWFLFFISGVSLLIILIDIALSKMDMNSIYTEFFLILSFTLSCFLILKRHWKLII
ncbi:lipopolysaccharide biosynthesis protein [Pedobacter sp. P351]|uniref:lipopolysaccharide biosynthesis protein n=1 Tax=Pedobacter superstes TaxID=3133441 RepID=UPI00309D0A69